MGRLPLSSAVAAVVALVLGGAAIAVGMDLVEPPPALRAPGRTYALGGVLLTLGGVGTLARGVPAVQAAVTGTALCTLAVSMGWAAVSGTAPGGGPLGLGARAGFAVGGLLLLVLLVRSLARDARPARAGGAA